MISCCNSKAEPTGTDMPVLECGTVTITEVGPLVEVLAFDRLPKGPTASFTIQVVGVRGIRNSEQPPMPPSATPPPELDCYINIIMRSGNLMRSGDLIGTANVLADSPQPIQPEEFDVTECSQGDELEFKVYAQDRVGEVIMKPEQFATDGFNNYILLQDTGANIQAYLGLKIKPTGREYPADPPSTFVVEVEKGKQGNYGMLLDYSDGKHLMLWGLRAGAFADYNKKAEPSKQLMRSDVIVSVNDETMVADCVRQFEEQIVTCVMKRSRGFSCILEREDLQKPLGLTFPAELHTHGYGLPIVGFSVTEGAAREYNEKCARECDKLKVYDRVVNVGGETGFAPDLKAKMENAMGKFQVQIVRPPLLETQTFA